MYSKSVNRGLAFTKPGLYATLLILLVGMMALGLGLNILYFVVSLALALIVISSLTSERVIKNCEVVSITNKVAEAKKPFRLLYRVKNESSTDTIYGYESIFDTKQFNVKVFTDAKKFLFSGRANKIAPNETALVSASCDGLKRGIYTDFNVLSRTLYPFGLIEKFKVSSLTTHLSVIPSLDTGLYEELLQMVRHNSKLYSNNLEYFCHRSFNTKDSIRIVDWKKSAGKSLDKWVVKINKNQVQNDSYIIEAMWGEALSAEGSEVYEGFLSRIRTVCEVFQTLDLPFYLKMSDRMIFKGYSNSVDALALLPDFECRMEGDSGVEKLFHKNDVKGTKFLLSKESYELSVA